LRAGERGRKGKKELTRRAGLAERGRRGAALGLGKGKWAGAWPMLERGGKGPEGEKEEREVGRAERGLGCFFSLFFSFFLSALKPFKPSHLNSKKFEFNPNTNKTMHQHECTNKLTL
jgi:hypothetical protein